MAFTPYNSPDNTNILGVEMQGQVSGVRVVMVLLLWIGLFAGAGFYAGEHWLRSLGGEACAMIGGWLGSILGLLHVLITLMRSRRIT
jgi:hypothetical protein